MQTNSAILMNRRRPAGRLVIVGTGVTAVSHITLEAIGQIKAADTVFHHETNDVTAAYVRRLNPRVIDLHQYYGTDKLRKVTYIQIAEVMLREVRQGRHVVGVFPGHPGILVMAVRRALAIAEIQGYETHLLPAISSIDCLFADLRIDPGPYGVQILKAGLVLRKETVLATAGHLVLLQVDSVGDSTYSFGGFKHTHHVPLIERLIKNYGAQHEAVDYAASILPTAAPAITPRPLVEYLDRVPWGAMGPGTLYLPPAGMTLRSVITKQALSNSLPYGESEMLAIAELDDYQMPKGYTQKLASKGVLDVMTELGTNPEAARIYHQSPDEYLGQRPDLGEEEKEALLNRRKKTASNKMQT
jgi:precorrin-2 methylase